MPPIWKIKRELHVVWSQFRMIPEIFLGWILLRIYDRHMVEKVKVTSGLCQLTDKVALFLLYQPRGIEQSAIKTCMHLKSLGYSVLIISNCNLKDEDVAFLSSVSWKIVERPNIGYDFGGYRDGIRLLHYWGVHPEVLFIINDSIWFPIFEDDFLIQKMELSEACFVGPTLFGDDRANRVRGRTRFLGSFMLMFKRPLLGGYAFNRFWSSYRMTSNKWATMRRGERGLSVAMIEAGFAPHGIVSRESFITSVQALDRDSLVQALTDLNCLDRDVIKERDRLVSEISSQLNTGSIDPNEPSLIDFGLYRDWAARASDFLIASSERPNFVVTAPIFAIQNSGLSYLKKRMDLPLYVKALEHVLQAESSNRIPQLESNVRREIVNRLHT